jgi:starvation-inducible DNA-binding protein
MKIDIGISQEKLQDASKLLSTILADEVMLYTKTRKFHWNVSGNSFMELHLLFEGQYDELEVIIDEVAERINQLGHRAIGTMKEFLDHTNLKENPGENPAPKDMVSELLQDHETVIKNIRKSVAECEEMKDAGTTDFLTSVMMKHEKTAWILRRYLS